MIEITTMQWERILTILSNDHSLNWESSEGPDSKVGVDYYFQNPVTGQEAYINKDQDHVSITIDDNTVWTGEEAQLELLVPNYQRVSAWTEDSQDSTKLQAALVNAAEAIAAQHTFKLFDIDCETADLKEPVLYTVDIALANGGGTYQEFRTPDEVLKILKEDCRLSEADATQLFQNWAKTGESPQKTKGHEIHLDETRITTDAQGKKFGDVIRDPDMVGTSSYRAAAELATTVAEIDNDPSDVEETEPVGPEALQAIEVEMGELISNALEIASNCKTLDRN